MQPLGHLGPEERDLLRDEFLRVADRVPEEGRDGAGPGLGHGRS